MRAAPASAEPGASAAVAAQEAWVALAGWVVPVADRAAALAAEVLAEVLERVQGAVDPAAPAGLPGECLPAERRPGLRVGCLPAERHPESGALVCRLLVQSLPETHLLLV